MLKAKAEEDIDIRGWKEIQLVQRHILHLLEFTPQNYYIWCLIIINILIHLSLLLRNFKMRITAILINKLPEPIGYDILKTNL
ncbi:MAG: hypothetical protein AMR96_06805 [Candidatus Adiutrix intracellularis]|nr:MAG: hypothetical protein AMR96_06805 [Candidatus Adiutrix intracellularis]